MCEDYIYIISHLVYHIKPVNYLVNFTFLITSKSYGLFHILFLAVKITIDDNKLNLI